MASEPSPPSPPWTSRRLTALATAVALVRIGAGDALDVAAGLAAARRMGARGVLPAAVAAPMVVLDCVTLAELMRARRANAPPSGPR